MTEAAIHDMYKPLTPVNGKMIAPCPCCGAVAELWQFSETPTSDCLKVVMCSTAEGIGPQDGIANEGCLLYMPGDDFYRPTQREANKHWNAFATALTALRVANGQPRLAAAGTTQEQRP